MFVSVSIVHIGGCILKREGKYDVIRKCAFRSDGDFFKSGGKHESEPVFVSTQTILLLMFLSPSRSQLVYVSISANRQSLSCLPPH